MKTFDIFWNISDYSNIISFDYSKDCLTEDICRWKYWNSTEKSSTNSSVVKKNIGQDSDILNPYFLSYKNLNSIRESTNPRNTYINKWDLLEKWFEWSHQNNWTSQLFFLIEHFLDFL